jgi:hypothetical protein
MLVTEFGGALIKSYRDLEQEFATLAARRLHAILLTVILHSKSVARMRRRQSKVIYPNHRYPS